MSRTCLVLHEFQSALILPSNRHQVSHFTLQADSAHVDSLCCLPPERMWIGQKNQKMSLLVAFNFANDPTYCDSSRENLHWKFVTMHHTASFEAGRVHERVLGLMFYMSSPLLWKCCTLLVTLLVVLGHFCCKIAFMFEALKLFTTISSCIPISGNDPEWSDSGSWMALKKSVKVGDMELWAATQTTSGSFELSNQCYHPTT